MIYLTLIGSFVKKHWLPIALIASFILYSGYMYNKGKSACEAKIDRAVAEELAKQTKELDELSSRYRQLLDRINAKPSLSDDEASCILSNNPLRKDCLK